MSNSPAISETFSGTMARLCTYHHSLISQRDRSLGEWFHLAQDYASDVESLGLMSAGTQAIFPLLTLHSSNFLWSSSWWQRFALHSLYKYFLSSHFSNPSQTHSLFLRERKLQSHLLSWLLPSSTHLTLPGTSLPSHFLKITTSTFF